MKDKPEIRKIVRSGGARYIRIPANTIPEQIDHVLISRLGDGLDIQPINPETLIPKKAGQRGKA